MRELLRTNDPVRLNRAATLLHGEGIPSFALDQYMSVMEGSLGILPQRLMVADRDHFVATAILRDNELLDGF